MNGHSWIRFGIVGLISLIFIGLLSLSYTATLPKFSLGFPLRCKPNENCWIVTYIDHDPSPAIRDYTCGYRTYNGHNGIDIGLENMRAMEVGVPVIAAAEGVVKAVRNDEPDVPAYVRGDGAIKGRECGNGALLMHPNGYSTQYCHLKKGSIQVRPGQKVQFGESLGLVGLSGLTEFPHLHFTVRYENRIMDPFAGLNLSQKCQKPPIYRPLWNASTLSHLPYKPVLIYQIGVADSIPKLEEIEVAQVPTNSLSPVSSAIIVWTILYGVEAGDTLLLKITSPDGRVLIDSTTVVTQRNVRYFKYIGKRRKGANWPAGLYRGQVILKRKLGNIEEKRSIQFNIS